MSYREEFDGYGVPEPEEPWGYNLDDFGAFYGPGEWPFWTTTGGNPVPGCPEIPEKKAPCRLLRLAPNTAYQSWRQAYMMVRCTENGGYELDFGWAIRPQGLGQHVAHVTVHLDRLLRIRNWHSFPMEALKQVRARVEKFRVFLKEHQEARDQGHKRPVTAHALYEKEKSC